MVNFSFLQFFVHSFFRSAILSPANEIFRTAKIFPYEKMLDEKLCDEKMHRQKMRNEKNADEKNADEKMSDEKNAGRKTAWNQNMCCVSE